jgi:hypothetical protein
VLGWPMPGGQVEHMILQIRRKWARAEPRL